MVNFKPDTLLSKKILFVIPLIILLNVAPQLYFWDHVTDDAYISFRYAERLLDGDGLTFNPGEKVEGFSNPLWIFVIAASSKITSVELPSISRIIGFLLSLFTFLFLYLISEKLFKDYRSSLVFIFSSLVIFGTPGFHTYSTTGLEGPLLGFLLISSVYFSLSNSKKHLSIAAFLIGLVGITRPEGPLYGILWLLFTFKSYPGGWSDFVKRTIIWLTPISAYVIFRLLYFKQLLPNTAYAKPSGTYGYLFGTSDSLMYFVVLSIPLTLVLLFYYYNFSKHDNNFFSTISGIILANLIFLIYAGGDWMLFGRFILPVWPILVLAFAFLIIHFISSIKVDERTIRYITYFAMITIMVTEMLVWRDDLSDYMSNSIYANLMKGRDQLKVGVWLNENVKANSTVATFRLGGISYGAPELVFYDTYGLTDKEAAAYRSLNKTGSSVADHPVMKRDPDVLAVINQNGYRMVTPETLTGIYEHMEANYDFIKSFPQGHNVNFEIWISKKKKEEILLY